jgi:hypothetical protein
MKGDFTRTTFRRRRHYRGVRLQQGRVQLDADFNEQSDITAHHDRQTASDLIGACGAPDVGGGFKISPAVRLAGLDLAGAAARAVGGRGTALGAANIDGSAAWTQDPTPTTNELHAVDAVDATRAFAVGEGATILIASGAAWAAQSAPSGTTGALRGVSFADASNGFAVGDDQRWHGVGEAEPTLRRAGCAPRRLRGCGRPGLGGRRFRPNSGPGTGRHELGGAQPAGRVRPHAARRALPRREQRHRGR